MKAKLALSGLMVVVTLVGCSHVPPQVNAGSSRAAKVDPASSGNDSRDSYLALPPFGE
jgi:hypothetical protein